MGSSLGWKIDHHGSTTGAGGWRFHLRQHPCCTAAFEFAAEHFTPEAGTMDWTIRCRGALVPGLGSFLLGLILNDVQGFSMTLPFQKMQVMLGVRPE